jgi:hypothetical protein
VILLASRFLALLPGCEGRDEGNTGFRTGEFGTPQGGLASYHPLVCSNGVMSERLIRRGGTGFSRVDGVLCRQLLDASPGCHWRLMGAICLIVGLRLAIVKHVAEAPGGVVKVSSQPGRRSTFAINLPAAAESLPY